MARNAVFFCLMLAILPFEPMGVRGQSDALATLDQVTKRYAEAQQYRIEAVIESRHTSAWSNSWQKSTQSAEVGTEGRYRYEGRTAIGWGIVASDGTTEVNLHRSFGDYTRRPAGSYGHPFSKALQDNDDGAEHGAFFLRESLAMAGDFVKSAHFLNDETIQVGDRKVACQVVTFGPDDLRKPFPQASTHWTYWIDKRRRTIVKSLLVSETKGPYNMNRTAVEPILTRSEAETLFPVVQLGDETVFGDDFNFTPPANSTLVSEFPPPFGISRVSSPSASAAKLPGMVGNMAPSITYHAADGTPFQLESLRGHAVVVDLWATWCGPCIAEMPTLDRIYRQTKAAGLILVGFDEDADLTTAPEYLKRKGYDWPDYHIDTTKAYGLPNTGIPLLVLIDEQGKIVYYHDGGDDEAGLEAAIKALGQKYASALTSGPWE